MMRFFPGATPVLLVIALMACNTEHAQADLIITPFVGYTMGGEAKTGDDKSYDISPSANAAIAIELPFQNGRMGVFYAQQDSSLEQLNLNSSISYLHFQSSVVYPITENTSSYLGIGIGASHVSADWTKNHTGFSTSLFGGLEYKITKQLSLTGQIRWLGTVVDSESVSICTLPTTEQSCLIGFQTQWMNQFQSNVGISIAF
ncbi:porin family protein [Vibrio sp. ZSDZ34]|uniref:Porin family protein n=1 Tax=Vibrio gelatinilyticus TaxID=2893468 RepID=A0A9X1W890_9VIBR|nr:porin family protein [Vibrio gelatinilyticus]MCJ2375439.1 porin family protein [Vibrio gelatinilyticus]